MLEHDKYRGADLPVWGVESDALQHLIRFFYTGECALSVDNVAAVCDTAQRLDIVGLPEACNDYVRDALDATTVCALWRQARLHGLEQLEATCLAYINASFTSMGRAKDFTSLSWPEVSELLTRCRPAQTDIALFTTAWAWVTADPAHMQHLEDVAKLLQLQDLSLYDLVRMAGSSGSSSSMVPPPTSAAAVVRETGPVAGALDLSKETKTVAVPSSATAAAAVVPAPAGDTLTGTGSGSISISGGPSATTPTRHVQASVGPATVPLPLPVVPLSGGMTAGAPPPGTASDVSGQAAWGLAGGDADTSDESKVQPGAAAAQGPAAVAKAAAEQPGGGITATPAMNLQLQLQPPQARQGMGAGRAPFSAGTVATSAAATAMSGGFRPGLLQQMLAAAAAKQGFSLGGLPIPTILPPLGLLQQALANASGAGRAMEAAAARMADAAGGSRAPMGGLQQPPSGAAAAAAKPASISSAGGARAPASGAPSAAANVANGGRGAAPPTAAAVAAAAAASRATQAALAARSCSYSGCSTATLPPSEVSYLQLAIRNNIPGPVRSAASTAVSVNDKEASRSTANSRGVCQVDGCYSDLAGLRDYHLRYKICEYHLKVGSILREGAPHRFCQQCGRFHPVAEFDGAKRSCKARLQRHNARRRKRTDGNEEGAGDASEGPAAPAVSKRVRHAGSTAAQKKQAAQRQPPQLPAQQLQPQPQQQPPPQQQQQPLPPQHVAQQQQQQQQQMWTQVQFQQGLQPPAQQRGGGQQQQQQQPSQHLDSRHSGTPTQTARQRGGQPRRPPVPLDEGPSRLQMLVDAIQLENTQFGLSDDGDPVDGGPTDGSTAGGVGSGSGSGSGDDRATGRGGGSGTRTSRRLPAASTKAEERLAAIAGLRAERDRAGASPATSGQPQRFGGRQTSA